MSLIPRLPCRKLFCDSRFAIPGGNATQFEIEIPQGGLNLPDNCVAFIDQISVPSFENVFVGKHRLYYRETSASAITYRAVEVDGFNYTLSGFASQLDAILTTATTNFGSNRLSCAPQNGLKFSLTGSDATQSAKILTDEEIRDPTGPG